MSYYIKIERIIKIEEKNYHHGDLKKQMILKGLELLNEKGIDGFSLSIMQLRCFNILKYQKKSTL